MITAEDIRDILRPFCDAATELKITSSGESAKVQMTRFGTLRTYIIQLVTGAVELREASRKFSALDSLLASDEFADLQHLANTQQRILDDRFRDQPFVQPELTLDDHRAVVAELDAAFVSPSNERLRIVLLDGPAGVGKTHLIERISLARATTYAKGGVLQPPVLHVTSRGRRLSNLNDALAATLNELSARFRFMEVPVLVRRGLLLLAIDGFDELVDAEGYHDAWHALRAFLENIGAGGCCILAGRDTFFDQQGFLDRLQQARTRMSLVLAHLHPLRPDAARRWLMEQGWPAGEFLDEDVLFEQDSYMLRPYFLRELAPLKGWSALYGRSPRDFLINKFLEREAKLVSKMVEVQANPARFALIQLYQDIALDMMDRNSDVVDFEFLRLSCEVAFTGVLTSDDIRKLMHKMGSTALLEKANDSNLRKFPHSEVQHHFLAHALIASDARDQVRRILRRAVLGADFLEVFLEVCEEIGKGRVSTLLEAIQAILYLESGMDRMPQNGGALLIVATAAGFAGTTRAIANVDAIEVVMRGTAETTLLRNVSIGQMQARGADLRQVTFESCAVGVLIGDETTRFGSTVPNVSVIHEISPGTVKTLRAPADVQQWLRVHSTEGNSSLSSNVDAELALVKFFDRVCRRALHQVYMREHADDVGGKLLSEPLWRELEKILDDENHIRRLTPPMHGPASYLIHIKNPRALLNPPADDPVAQRIRDRVHARAKELAAIRIA